MQHGTACAPRHGVKPAGLTSCVVLGRVPPPTCRHSLLLSVGSKMHTARPRLWHTRQCSMPARHHAAGGSSICRLRKQQSVLCRVGSQPEVYAAAVVTEEEVAGTAGGTPPKQQPTQAASQAAAAQVAAAEAAAAETASALAALLRGSSASSSSSSVAAAAIEPESAEAAAFHALQAATADKLATLQHVVEDSNAVLSEEATHQLAEVLYKLEQLEQDLSAAMHSTTQGGSATGAPSASALAALAAAAEAAALAPTASTPPTTRAVEPAATAPVAAARALQTPADAKLEASPAVARAAAEAASVLATVEEQDMTAAAMQTAVPAQQVLPMQQLAGQQQAVQLRAPTSTAEAMVAVELTASAAAIVELSCVAAAVELSAAAAAASVADNGEETEQQSTASGSSTASSSTISTDALDSAKLWALFVLALAYAHQATTGFALPALLPQVSPDLHLSDFQGAMLTSGYSYLYALALVPVGLLADRANRPRLLAAGLALWSVLSMVSSQAQSFRELLAARVGFAAAQAAQNPVSFSLIPDLFPNNKSTALAAYNCAIYLGRALSFASVLLANRINGGVAAVSAADGAAGGEPGVALSMVPLDKLDLQHMSIIYTTGDMAAVAPVYNYNFHVIAYDATVAAGDGAWRHLLYWLALPGFVIALMMLTSVAEPREEEARQRQQQQRQQERQQQQRRRQQQEAAAGGSGGSKAWPGARFAARRRRDAVANAAKQQLERARQLLAGWFGNIDGTSSSSSSNGSGSGSAAASSHGDLTRLEHNAAATTLSAAAAALATAEQQQQSAQLALVGAAPATGAPASAAPAAVADAGGAPLAAIKGLLDMPGFRAVTMAAALNDLGSYALIAWQSTFYERVFQLDSSVYAPVLAVILPVGGIMGGVGGGLIADWLAKFGGRYWLTVGASVMAAPFIAQSLLADNPRQSFIALLLGFALSEAWRAPSAIMIRSIAPQEMGSSASALYLCIRNLVGGLGPVAVAQLSGVMGLRQAMLLAPACYAVSGALFAVAEWIIAQDQQTLLLAAPKAVEPEVLAPEPAAAASAAAAAGAAAAAAAVGSQEEVIEVVRAKDAHSSISNGKAVGVLRSLDDAKKALEEQLLLEQEDMNGQQQLQQLAHTASQQQQEQQTQQQGQEQEQRQ